MICNCGWKYDPTENKTCPKCDEKPEEPASGIGLPNKRDASGAAVKSAGLSRSVRVNPISKRRKRRLSSGKGEKPLFEKIWKVRKHKCQNLECGDDLPSPARAHYFAHIHSKGARPDLRLNPANIPLLCIDCEKKSCDEGWKSIKLSEPYRSMRDNPPKFNPKHQ